MKEMRLNDWRPLTTTGMFLATTDVLLATTDALLTTTGDHWRPLMPVWAYGAN